MKYPLSGVVAITALGLAGPVVAADYAALQPATLQPSYSGLRPSYPEEWDMGEENDLRFEAGVRYWWSQGGHDLRFPGGSSDTELSVRDQAHIGETHVRIEDLYTQSYVNAYGGMSVTSSGTVTMEQPGAPSFDGELNGTGRLGYVVADYGWMPFGNMREGFALGGLVGYQYWHEAVNAGRGEFAVVKDESSVKWVEGSPNYQLGYDSETNSLDVHALRLGVTTQAALNDVFDVRAEVAAIPYAYIGGTLGSHAEPTYSYNGGKSYKASATSVSGTGFGGAGQVTLGFHPTENLTLRVGGRAWYVGGTVDGTYTRANITDPMDTDPDTPGYEQGPSVALQDYIHTSEFAQIFRYGALFELTGRF